MSEYRYWKVTVDIPKDDPRFVGFIITKHIGVVAKDVQEVVNSIKKKYPNNNIATINYVGDVDILNAGE